jgi:hypothetical protein
VVLTVVLCALVAAGALTAAAVLKHQRDTDRANSASTPSPSATTGPGADGCLTPPCQTLGTATVGGTVIDLVGDRGGTSGRLLIGGVGSGDVVEVTITERGAVLEKDFALQCVPAARSACMVRGHAPDGVVGEVVAVAAEGWTEATANPFVSDAGWLLLADMTGDDTPEVLAAQYDCDRAQTPDCTTTPVYVQVFDLDSATLGCTRNYARLGSLPEWPDPDLSRVELRECG